MGTKSCSSKCDETLSTIKDQLNFTNDQETNKKKDVFEEHLSRNRGRQLKSIPEELNSCS